MNAIPYIEIQAESPERAVNFYKEIFGWKFEKDPNIPIEYWRLEAGGVRGGVLKRPAKTPPKEHGTNAFTCSFEVEKFDATAQKIIVLGGQVAMEKFAVPGKCWQGYFLDTENNVFGVFEPDENAK